MGLLLWEGELPRLLLGHSQTSLAVPACDLPHGGMPLQATTLLQILPAWDHDPPLPKFCLYMP